MHIHTSRRLLMLMRDKREIGPVGTVARLIVGAAAIAVPVLIQVLSDEFSLWDVLVGLVALPIVATAGFEVVRAAYERYVPGGLASQSGTCCFGAATWLIAIVFAAVIPLAAFTRVTDAAFWIWIGASMLLAAARGYGGCEILAFPNILAGRRDQVGCILFTPIDQAEERARRPRLSTAEPEASTSNLNEGRRALLLCCLRLRGR